MFKQTKEIIEDTVCCVGCGSKPILWHYDTDLYYVECPNHDCKKFAKWSCLGSSPIFAINAWEQLNRPIKRKKDENNSIQSTDA